MRSLYQVLKASKFDPVSAPDMFTALWAKNISGGGSVPTEHEYTGTVPTPITANGEPLIAWTVYGNQKPYENLFDITTNPMEQGSISGTDGTNSSSVARIRCKNKIDMQQGTYTINANSSKALQVFLFIYNSNGVFEERRPSGWKNLPYSFKIEETKKMRFVIRYEDNTNITTSDVEKIMLNSGPTALPFVPHDNTPTPSVPIYQSETGDKTSNLLETRTQGYAIDASGNINTNSSFMYYTAPCEAGETYTFSLDSGLSGNNVRIHAFNGDTWIEQLSGANIANAPFTVTTPANTTNLKISIVNLATAYHCMLNTGNTPKSYEPNGFVLPVQCGGVTTPVYTAEPIRKIGDYTDYKSNAAEYRVIKKLVLTGEEVTDFYRKNNTSSDNSLYYIRFAALQSAPLSSSPLYCTHLPDINYTPSEVVGITVSSTYSVIYFNFGLDVMSAQPSGNTVEGLREYLATQYAAGTPVTIWYVLATPTTTTVEGPEIPTSNGEQTFDVTTELEPSSVYIKYKG